MFIYIKIHINIIIHSDELKIKLNTNKSLIKFSNLKSKNIFYTTYSKKFR